MITLPTGCTDELLRVRRLYLELLKRSLTGVTIEDESLLRLDDQRGVQLGVFPYDPVLREKGRDSPSRALTMIGLRRMDQLQDAIETVLAEDIPGDLIETGV